jgi:hypothetical protein
MELTDALCRSNEPIMKTACFVILDGRRNMICLPCVQCIVWPLLDDLPSF